VERACDAYGVILNERSGTRHVDAGATARRRREAKPDA
jgi:hypothetical protein